jgi:hypothetical protein
VDDYDEEYYWSEGSGKGEGGNRDVPLSSRHPDTGKAAAAAAAGLAAMAAASTSFIATPGYDDEVSWEACCYHVL